MSTFRERGVGMSNIPTDKLRSLVALADLRSFTLAAQSLGTTQPNISVHSKYPPAEPGALGSGPLEAAVGVADAAPIL
jgi:hypothetical protein